VKKFVKEFPTRNWFVVFDCMWVAEEGQSNQYTFYHKPGSRKSIRRGLLRTLIQLRSWC